MLLIDGFSGHEDAGLCQELQDKNIILYEFVPHSSHISQPLDKAFYRSFKAKLRTARHFSAFLRFCLIVLPRRPI